MTTVAVIGGTGFLGSHVGARCLEETDTTRVERTLNPCSEWMQS